MADADLNIVLKLIDQASDEIKKSMQGIKKDTEGVKEETQNLKKKTDETSDSIKKGFKDAGKQVKDFRQTLLPVTIAITSLIAVTKVWAERNKETQDAYFKIGTSIKNLASDIGSIFAPAIISLSDVIQRSTEFLSGFFTKTKEAYKSLAETITFSTQFWVAFFASIKDGQSISDATAISLKVAGDAAKEVGQSFKSAFTENIPDLTESKRQLDLYADKFKEIETLFLTGKISAEQYYQSLLELQNQQINLNQISAQQLRELASLTSQVRNTEILEAQRSTQEQINLLNFYKETYMTAHQGMAAFTVALGQSIQTNLSSALTGVVTGAKTAKQAFSELGQAMIQTIVEFMAQKLVASVLEKTLLAGTVAASAAAGSAVAAAWASAAAMVSLATFGANAGPAAAGIATVNALAAGLAAAGSAVGNSSAASNVVDLGTISVQGGRKFHSGGPIRAHNGLAVDEVPIIAQTGEGVLSRKGMSALGGEENLNRLNQGQGISSGGVSIVINYPKFNSKEDIDELVNQIGFRIQQQLRY